MLYLLLPLILLLIYFYFTKNHNYWQKRHVKHDQPIPIFGNIYQNIFFKKSITEIITELYYKYPNEKVVGLYSGTTPELIIRDLELVKRILNVDFAYFYQRGLGRDPKREPLYANLFHAEGDSWKLLRERWTAAFTVAKLKKMFPLVIEYAEKLQSVGEDIVNKGCECDVRELMTGFTSEFIAACGFGLRLEGMNNESPLFKKIYKLIIKKHRSWNNILILALYRLLPDFKTFLVKVLSDDELLNTTNEMLRTVLSRRNNEPCDRHDFIDLLLMLQKKGKIISESMEHRNPDGSPVMVEMEMDFQCMAAQVIIFFGAGFENSSVASSYLLHELAFHPEEQKKIQKEIDQVLAKYDNKLCYDSVAEMNYLKMAFQEAMRKFSPAGTLQRICVRQYTIPELGITIDPGVKVIIPVQAIHTDEKYFDNPSQFKPERFANASNWNKYIFLPFGAGPRRCIGSRLGEMQSLAGLAAVLQKFSFEPGVSTKQKLEVNPKSNTIQTPKGGLPLKMTIRHNKNIKAGL